MTSEKTAELVQRVASRVAGDRESRDLAHFTESEYRRAERDREALQEQLDEYIEAMQLKISDAMRMKLLTIYRNEHGP